MAWETGPGTRTVDGGLRQLEPGHGPRSREEPHRPRLRPAHRALGRGPKVVVAREVEPAVDQVERDLVRKAAPCGVRVPRRCVHRDADLARDAVRAVAPKRDHVGGRGVPEKAGGESGERRVPEERDRQRAGRASPPEPAGMGVKQADCRGHRLSVDSQAGMAVGDVEGAPSAFHAFASLGGSPADEYATLEWSMLRRVKVKLFRIFARSSNVSGARSSCPSATRSAISLSMRDPSFSAVIVRTERVTASTPSASDTTALSLNCGLGPS